MELQLKKLVIRLGICSEAEIFASNLQYKIFKRLAGETDIKTYGKPADIRKKIKIKLTTLVEAFSEIFESIAKELEPDHIDQEED